MQILDGKVVSEKILNKIKEETKTLKHKPGFAILQIGNEHASNIYVERKKKVAQELGFFCVHLKFDLDIEKIALEKVIHELNNEETIDGIILQLPIPIHLKSVLNNIAFHKDIDGLGVIQQGNLALNLVGLRPCTPRGIISLLKEYGIEICNTNSCIIGRSPLVGQSLALMLLHENSTVTVTHSKTQNLKKHTLNADIIFSATGQTHFLTPDMLKQDSIVIDVGINRIDEKITGDLAPETYEKIKAYTPTPGGIGPMTIASLFENVFTAYKAHKNK